MTVKTALPLALATALLAACSDSNGPAASRSYFGTQRPGDAWTWTIGASTFDATNVTTGYTYAGDKTTLPSGFLKLTVRASTEPGMTLPATAYALEYPNTVLLIKPAGPDPMIVAVGLGSCPVGAQDYNWVDMPHAGWDATVGEAYGTATITPMSPSSDSINGDKYRLDGAAVTPGVAVTAGCAGGQLTIAPSGSGGVTPSRAVVVDDGPGEGGVVGLVAPTTNVDVAALGARNYRGVLFKNASGGDETQPIGVDPAGGGNLTGYCFANVETGEHCASGGVTLLLSAATQPSPGILRFQLSEGTLHDFVAAVSQVGGKYILFGLSTNASSTEPYNVMLIEQ
jgi:hypothetical protein